MKPSKRNNKKGLIGTIIFHSALLLLFFFTGLSYTIPPPPEEGISINFGNEEIANGNNDNQEEMSEINTPKTIESNTAAEEIFIQENIETLKTNKEEKEENSNKVETTKNEINSNEPNVKEPETNKRAIYNPNKNKGSDGNKSSSGDMGDINGELKADSYNGGGFGAGLSAIGNSRRIPDEALDHQLGMGEGYILLNVIVNSDGEIIEIDNNFVYSTIGFISAGKKRSLFNAIKEQLKYGSANGEDKSNKRAELKVSFTY